MRNKFWTNILSYQVFKIQTQFWTEFKIFMFLIDLKVRDDKNINI